MKKKIKSVAELPRDFSVRNYAFLRDLDAQEWSFLLASRLDVEEALTRVDQHRMILLANPDEDEREIERSIAEELAQCVERTDEHTRVPNIGVVDWPSKYAVRLASNMTELRFGPVSCLSVKAAHSIRARLHDLHPRYLSAISDLDRVLEEGGEELCNASAALVDQSLFHALEQSGVQFGADPWPTFGEEELESLDNEGVYASPWRAVGVDLDATDEEVMRAFADWLTAARGIDRFKSAGRVPNETMRMRWISDRILPYVDLTQWARARESELSWPVLQRALFPDLEISEGKIRKTTHKNAMIWLSSRMLRALVRLASNEGGGLFPERSFDR